MQNGHATCDATHHSSKLLLIIECPLGALAAPARFAKFANVSSSWNGKHLQLDMDHYRPGFHHAKAPLFFRCQSHHISTPWDVLAALAWADPNLGLAAATLISTAWACDDVFGRLSPNGWGLSPVPWQTWCYLMMRFLKVCNVVDIYRTSCPWQVFCYQKID